MKMYKKTMALFLILMMIVSGLVVDFNRESEVQAAAGSGVTADTPEIGMLNVKMQTRKNRDGTTDMRLVSSVNGLGYQKVGFNVWFGDATVNPTTENVTATLNTGTVLKRIKAGVEYKFSPKVIDTSSEYFITGTVRNIAEANLGTNFYVKAFCVTLEGETVYGTGRFFKVEQACAENVINIPVAMKTEPTPEDLQKVTVGSKSAPATLEKYVDGVAHVNVLVSDKTSLASVTNITVGGCSTIYRNLDKQYTGVADTSWYDVYKAANSAEQQYVITNVADLYGLSEILAKFSTLNENFYQKTVYMASDLTVNEGDAGEWNAGASTPKYKWTPIGSEENGAGMWNGTFDGQNHVISGLYVNMTTSRAGLFGFATGNSQFKNLKIQNSCIKSTSTQVGALVGQVASGNGALIDTVSAENTYVSSSISGATYLGGLVGQVTGNTPLVTIQNSRFAGTVSGHQFLGGIVGTTNVPKVQIKNCDFSGKLTASMNNAGGLLGYSESTIIDIESSLVTGQMRVGSPHCQGSVVGRVNKEGATLTFTEVYTTDDILQSNDSAVKCFYNRGLGNNCTMVTPTTKCIVVSGGDILGMNGYQKMFLDFDEVWCAVDGKVPQLRAFTDEVLLELPAEVRVDTRWYDKNPSATNFQIGTKEELYGLASIVNNGNDLNGKTIELKKDITVNEGDAACWKTNAPKYSWTPIGGNGSSIYSFGGTFDGKDYSIRGLYFVNDNINLGLFGWINGNATIKNLKLDNSYFCATNTTQGLLDGESVALGGIVGKCIGKVHNVYVDENVYLECHGGHCGGIAGFSIYKDVVLSQCWFAGNIDMTSTGIRAGGIIGANHTKKITLINCLFSGTMTSSRTDAGPMMGGMIGFINSANADIQNCLITGTITSASDFTWGAVMGYANKYADSDQTIPITITLTNVYVQEDKITYDIGQGSALEPTVTVNHKTLSDMSHLTGFDYGTIWTARENNFPVLKSFAQ